MLPTKRWQRLSADEQRRGSSGPQYKRSTQTWIPSGESSCRPQEDLQPWQKWVDGFPQNHCRKRFGVAHAVLEAAADESGSEPASAESESAELPLRPMFGEVVEGCSQHPAGNSQWLS